MYEQAAPFRALREQILRLDPQSVGISETPQRPMFAYLLETGYSEAVATLVVIADGSVSLYFSNGGGMLGLGGDPAVRKAARELLAGARHFLAHCSPATAFPLPKMGHTRFYLLTFHGVRTAEAPDYDLGNGRLPMSPLFLKSHEVLGLIREAEERRQR